MRHFCFLSSALTFLLSALNTVVPLPLHHLRAKNITNKATVNVELSPAELKNALKKAMAELQTSRAYALSLETALRSIRPDEDLSNLVTSISATSSLSVSTSQHDDLLHPSRPPTSSSSSTLPISMNLQISEDERNEFLQRENDLMDQLVEKVIVSRFELKLIPPTRSRVWMSKKRASPC